MKCYLNLEFGDFTKKILSNLTLNSFKEALLCKCKYSVFPLLVNFHSKFFDKYHNL